MQFSNLTHYYLRKFHDKKNYVTENRWILILLILNTCLWMLLITGNLSLDGLKLHGSIKSSASHCHGSYDNSFVTGLDKTGSIRGTSLEAVNLRATGGAVTAWYMLNEGAMYQHGSILFSKVTYPFGKFPLGVPYFESTNLSITPDFEKERINFTGSVYIDKDGLTGISQKEIEKIKKQIITELNLKGSKVICGKE